MGTLPLARLGGRQTGPQRLDFGVLLPWVSPANGQAVLARVIHERDQFLQDIPPVDIPLTHETDPDYGDLWSGSVDLSAGVQPAGSHWGSPGQYVYRYVVTTPRGSVDWVIDPYAREFGVGKLSAVTLDYEPYQWSAHEADWRVPVQADMVLYEVNLAEFASGIPGAVARLDYLADLGVNAISLMPVSNIAAQVDWGYLPVAYFGVDERFGRRRDLQWLIDEAHQRGISVLVDAVYGHASRALFGYSYLYDRLGYWENPFMGPFAADLFDDQGRSVDFRRALVRDFYFAVSQHWLEVFHVDGFRYDCVPNYWNRRPGEESGYPRLLRRTYDWVSDRVAQGSLLRFAADDGLRLIQCAEHLDDPAGVLYETHSTSTWQNRTYGAAVDVARGRDGAIDRLGLALGLEGLPEGVPAEDVEIPKAGLQYIENHDHSRFVTEFGTLQKDEASNWVFLVGDRRNWYRVQPYLIALLMAKGIPLLWQGQELMEDATLPGFGLGRVGMLRPVNWDHFYDEPGRRTLGLTRRLLRLRRDRTQLRRGAHWFYNNADLYQSRGLLVFRRYSAEGDTIVAVNFTGTDRTTDFAFPQSGEWAEELHGLDNLTSHGAPQPITVPSNYGRVWTRVAP